jgi:hypothetical protein
MTTVNLVLLAMLILLCSFLFRLFSFSLKKKYGFRLVFFMYISILFCISFFCSCLRLYLISIFLNSAIPFLILSAFPFNGEIGPSNDGSGPSSTPESSFEIRVLMEPFSDTEEGTSARHSIPRVGEAGPSHQGSVVKNASLEASMRNRIVRLELDNSPYLLDKAKGEYWALVKQELDHASSQREYNLLLEFESRDLQIRERKLECLNLFNLVLSQNPPLADQAPYNPKEALPFWTS